MEFEIPKGIRKVTVVTMDFVGTDRDVLVYLKQATGAGSSYLIPKALRLLANNIPEDKTEAQKYLDSIT